MNILTFVYDIGRITPDRGEVITREILVKTFKLLYNSLDYFNENFTLHVYTNFDNHRDLEKEKSKIHYFPESLFKNKYKDSWINLSYNKIVAAENILKQYDSVLWIDLDTIVCKDISYINNLDNFFIKNNSGDQIQYINNQYSVKNKDWMMGHVWKVNQKTINSFKKIEQQVEEPRYDIQDYFTIMDQLGEEKMFFANEVSKDTVSTFEIYPDLTHPSPEVFNDSCKMQDNKIFSKQLNKQVEFLPFTFNKLEINLSNNFNGVVDPAFKNWLLYLLNKDNF